MNPQPSDEELKKTWRENWLSSINELTSLDLQKRSWLDKKNTNPHWTFVEFICCYFARSRKENPTGRGGSFGLPNMRLELDHEPPPALHPKIT